LHRKGLVIGILILLIGVNIGSSFAGDADVKTISSVSFDGNTIYVGGSGPNNYTMIQSAIDDAVDGDTVFVYDDSSPYYENIIVDKSINLVGENNSKTVIDGNRSVYVSVDWVNISEFTIQCGIFLDSCGNNIISDNIICNRSWSGIELSYSCNNIITDNKILGNVHGIELFHSSNNIITGNIIISNIGIIILSSSSNNNITGNKISNCFFGIMLVFSSKNIIEKNNFIGNIRHAIFSDLWRNILIKNCWDSNYWDNWIGFGPKIIFGRIGVTGFIPWINFDRHPAKEPYDIGITDVQP